MKSLEEKMPSIVSYLVLEELPPDDIYIFFRVCREAYAMVKDYVERRFSMMNLLLMFFNRHEAFQFWSLMATTGMLISGSSALQFFDRTHYPNSDLDVYVEEQKTLEIAVWLFSVGYQYRACGEDSSKTLKEMVARYGMHQVPSGDTLLPLSTHSYSGATMVLDFFHPLRSQKVQLITADVCPLQLIIRFHSTVVLNVISHSKAYSLYPIATFNQRRSLLQIKYSTNIHARAVEKYTRRGWLMLMNLSAEEAYEPNSPFSPGVRYLGDSRCWTINIAPPSGPPCMDNIEANRWLITLDPSRFSEVTATVFVSSRLEHGYTMSPCLSFKQIIGRFQKLKDAFPGNRYLDAECSHVFSQD